MRKLVTAVTVVLLLGLFIAVRISLADPCNFTTTTPKWEGEIRISGQCNIKQGVTLTIAAGTKVYFGSNASLVVQGGGTLKVLGKESNLVQFLPASGATAWKGITFMPGSVVKFGWCILKRAKEITWNGSITLSGKYEVGKDQTLIIKAGTTVGFESGGTLVVGCGARLVALGNEGSVITFESIAAVGKGPSKLISFLSSNDPAMKSTMEWCTVKGAQTTNIFIEGPFPRGASPTIKNCDIHHSQKGIEVRNSKPKITHNRIHHNIWGLHFVAGAAGEVAENLIYCNKRPAGVAFGTENGLHIWDNSSPCVKNNLIFGSDWGIEVGKKSNPLIQDNLFVEVNKGIMYYDDSFGPQLMSIPTVKDNYYLVYHAFTAAPKGAGYTTDLHSKQSKLITGNRGCVTVNASFARVGKPLPKNFCAQTRPLEFKLNLGSPASGKGPQSIQYALSKTVRFLIEQIGSYYPFPFLRAAQQLIFEGLTNISGHLQLIPFLASSWEPQEDGRVWTFHLQHGACFHSGKLVTAEDVAYSFAASEGFLGENDLVEALDEFTVKVRLESPDAAFPHRVSGMPIRPPESLDLIGTGPYRVLDWDLDVHMVLGRFEDYWGSVPPFDKICFIVVTELSKQLVMLQAKEANLIMDATREQFREAQHLAGLRGYSAPSSTYVSLDFNLNRRLFSEPLVRRAIMYAVDYRGLLEAVYEGLAAPCSGPIHPHYLGQDSSGWRYEYNPQMARQLMREAGWELSLGVWKKEGVALEFPIMVPADYPGLIRVANAIQASFAEFGAVAEICSLSEWAYREMLNKGDFYASLSLHSAGYPLPDLDHWMSWASANVYGYSNPEVDRLISQLRSELNPDVRGQIYLRLDNLIAGDFPCVWLLYPDQFVIANDELDVALTTWELAVGSETGHPNLQVIGDRAFNP